MSKICSVCKVCGALKFIRLPASAHMGNDVWQRFMDPVATASFRQEWPTANLEARNVQVVVYIVRVSSNLTAVKSQAAWPSGLRRYAFTFAVSYDHHVCSSDVIASAWHRHGIGMALAWHWHGIGMAFAWHWHGIGTRSSYTFCNFQITFFCIRNST